MPVCCLAAETSVNKAIRPHYRHDVRYVTSACDVIICGELSTHIIGSAFATDNSIDEGDPKEGEREENGGGGVWLAIICQLA